MSFLNALASGGLSVGLRIANAGMNDRAAVRQREDNLPLPPDDLPCCPVTAKNPAPKTSPKSEEQRAEDRAAGRLEASSLLAAEACLGRIQVAGEESPKKTGDKKGDNQNEGDSPSGEDNLSEEEKQQVQELQRRDREVKAHEQAHIAASAGLAGAPSYEYQTGPDGKRYAVGGEVSLRSGGSSDPETALREAETIKRAATAPAEPSSTDRAVAAQASADINRLKAEKSAQNREENQSGDEGESSSPEDQERNSQVYNGETPGRKALGAYNAVKLGFGQALFRPVLAQA